MWMKASGPNTSLAVIRYVDGSNEYFKASEEMFDHTFLKLISEKIYQE